MPSHEGRWLMFERAMIWAGPVLLLAAGLVPPLRPPISIVLLLGWVALQAGRRPEAVAWAAVLPVGVTLAWPWIVGVDAPLGEAGCIAPLSSIAVRRVVVAVVGIGLVGALAVVHRSSLAELGLRRPAPWEAGVAVVGVIVLSAGGLWIGPWIARPFFGPLDFPVPPAALLPAVLFGVANGMLEEVSYRGAMQAWLARAMPIGVAIGVQGVAFGIIHAGPDVVALLPVHVALLGGVGIAAGIARVRFGSLWIPIGIHVGADIALYVGLACRATA